MQAAIFFFFFFFYCAGSNPKKNGCLQNYTSGLCLRCAQAERDGVGSLDLAAPAFALVGLADFGDAASELDGALHQTCARREAQPPSRLPKQGLVAHSRLQPHVAHLPQRRRIEERNDLLRRPTLGG